MWRSEDCSQNVSIFKVLQFYQYGIIECSCQKQKQKNTLEVIWSKVLIFKIKKEKKKPWSLERGSDSLTDTQLIVTEPDQDPKSINS